MVLISNIKSEEKLHLGLGKTGLNSEVVLILGGLNCDILLYTSYNNVFYVWSPGSSVVLALA